MNDMTDLRTELTPKTPIIYSCIKCNFDTRNKKDFNRHLTTAKHIKLDTLNEVEPVSPQPIACSICQKEYVSRSGMWYHQKKCKGPTIETTEPPQTIFQKPEASQPPQTTLPKPEEMMALMFEFMRNKIPDKSDQSQLRLVN